MSRISFRAKRSTAPSGVKSFFNPARSYANLKRPSVVTTAMMHPAPKSTHEQVADAVARGDMTSAHAAAARYAETP